MQTVLGWGEWLDSDSGVCSITPEPARELVEAGIGASVTGSGVWKV